jgi:hypothetical protein
MRQGKNKAYLKRIIVTVCIWLIWIRLWSNGGIFCNKSSGFIKRGECHGPLYRIMHIICR